MARNFLGFDQRGMLGFDLGDGGPPAWLPVTPDTASEAMRLEAAAGRDPAAVLRRQGGASLTAPTGMALPPPAPGAMGPTALASGGPQASYEPGPPAPNASMAPPPQRPSMILDVDPGAPAPRAAAPLVPPGAPLRIESGPGDTSAAKAAGWSQAKIDADLKRQEFAPAPAPGGAPAPGLSAGDPSKLVPTPGQGGGAPSGLGSNLNAAEQELDNIYQAKMRAEASRRATPGTLIKGGKVQTGEQWQGAVGPDADTVEAMRANAQETARLQRIQAGALNERDLAAAKIAQEQADYETKAAEVQAQIAQRKQQALEGIGAQAQALQQRVASAEIDDGRWWGSKSAADKATIGIAVALDGIVRGLTGRPGQPNAVLQEVYRQQDRDLDVQIKNIEKARGDLNDIQKIYVQTKEQYGDEALAADAAKLAGLVGFKAKIQAEAAKADAVQITDPVFKKQQLAELAEIEQAMASALGADSEEARRISEAQVQRLASKTRSYSVRGKLLELDVNRRVLEQQAALEERMNGTIAKSFGFTQDRVVGGSSGPSLDRMEATAEKRAKLNRGADEAAAKGGKDQKAVFLDGRPLPAAPGASQGSVDKAQDLITFADQGLDMVASAEARSKQGGGFLPGDPRLKIAAAGITSVLSNAQGGGAPNDAVMETVMSALSPGPRQQAAIQELRGEFQSAKRRALQRVGAGKLWPNQRRRPSRCTTPGRGPLLSSPPTRPAPSSGRAGRPSPPTRTCPYRAPMAGCPSSRAARRVSTSPAPRGWWGARRRSRLSSSSASKTSSEASGAPSAPSLRGPPAAPRWAPATSSWPRRGWWTAAPSPASRTRTPWRAEGARPWASSGPPSPRAGAPGLPGERWAPPPASPRRLLVR